MSKKRLIVDRVFRMMDFRNKYREDSMKDQIEFSLTTHCERYHYVDKTVLYCPNEINRWDEMFEIRDGEIYCNKYGVDFIMSNFKYNFDDYYDAIFYLDSVEDDSYEEELPELDLEIKLTHDIERRVSDKIINKYYSNMCTSIPLAGKTMEEINVEKLHKKDIDTLNGTVKTFNDSSQEGIDSDFTRMDKVHRYVEDNDPDSIYRSFYYFDYDPIEYDDYAERFCFNEYEILRKVHKKEKKLRKQRKRQKKNKKGKK